MPITDEAKSIFLEIADDLNPSSQTNLIINKDKHDYQPERRSQERITNSVLDAFANMTDLTDAFAQDAESALVALNQLWDDD